MNQLSPDTTPDAQRKQIELMRRLSPSQKLSLAFALTDAMRDLILADLHHRFPQADEREIRRRFIARVLSREEVIRVYGFSQGGRLLKIMVLPISVVSLATNALDQLNIRYVLVGSFASSMYGLYRSTADIDILADLKVEHVGPLAEVLKDAFNVDELAMRKAIAQGGSFSAIHFESAFKIDFFVASEEEFATGQLDRGQLRNLSPDSNERIYAATAEDTVLAKLRWYRAGNEVSTNQWSDVLGILAVVGEELDVAYLRTWAERLDVSDLLQRAFSEVQSQGS